MKAVAGYIALTLLLSMAVSSAAHAEWKFTNAVAPLEPIRGQWFPIGSAPEWGIVLEGQLDLFLDVVRVRANANPNDYMYRAVLICNCPEPATRECVYDMPKAYGNGVRSGLSTTSGGCELGVWGMQASIWIP